MKILLVAFRGNDSETARLRPWLEARRARRLIEVNVRVRGWWTRCRSTLSNTTRRGDGRDLRARKVAVARIERAEMVASQPAREPTHPGAILREDVLPAIGESVADTAKKLRV